MKWDMTHFILLLLIGGVDQFHHLLEIKSSINLTYEVHEFKWGDCLAEIAGKYYHPTKSIL